MKLAALIFVDLLGASTLVVIVHLLRKQRLTLGLGAAWFFTVGGLICVTTISPLRSLFETLSSSLFD